MDQNELIEMSTETSRNVDGILYDLSYHVDFPEEKEVVRSPQLEEIPAGVIYSSAKSLKSSISRWTWSTIRAVGIPVRTGAPCLLPPDLIKLVNSKQSWTMARSPDGNFLAVLQDGCLEIRSAKEDYNTVVGRCVFSKDLYPQWRTVSWSRESTMVAFSDSDGTVHICDIKGILILSYHGHLTDDKETFDYSTAICALQFLHYSAMNCDSDSLLLMILSYSGFSTCLEVNENFDEGHRVLFHFDFSKILSKGVCAVTYDKNHCILVVGGCTGYGKDDIGVPRATKYGITAWRIISEKPFLKSIDVFIDASNIGRRRSIFRRLSTVPSDLGKKLRGADMDGVLAMTVSPSRRLLVVIHLSGALSLWEIPSFRQKHFWKGTEQPFYGEMPGDHSNSFLPPKKLKAPSHFQNIVDCKWWNDSSIIIARCSGSLAIVSVSEDRLESLFGDTCEWLEPMPEISFCFNEGFLALECESNVKALKRQRECSDGEIPNEDDFPSIEDSEDEEGTGVLLNLKNKTKSVIYQWSDIDYFRPPRKRPKLIRKSYRLLSITNTTPEKLFEKRLVDEEYGEALALAQRYDLDGDKVFQRQWKKSEVSIASIQDYLSKISKRSWVIHECCERVPDDLDASKELLKFALTVTDIDQLAKLSKSDINDEAYDSDCEEYQGFDVQEQRNQEVQRRHKFVEFWSKYVNFSDLSLDQKEMIRARTRIIKYIDRLSTYEHLLGGYDAARERYNKYDFADFRQKDMFVSALNYARNGNWKALDILLTFHGADLREHRLALLCSIPKTISPLEYKCLLPRIGRDGSVENTDEMKHSDMEDWCEKPEYLSMLMLTNPTAPATEFYEQYPFLLPFRNSDPTHKIVTDWYLQQAREFDRDALDIDGALKLLEIGTDYYVDGLDRLMDDLRTLETLVYDCKYDTVLTLKELQKKDNLERLKMLMETSSREMYVKNFHRWALPFLKGCKKDDMPSEIFEKYILEHAENDLTLPSLIFTSFLRDRSMPENISSTANLAKLALKCIYVNTDANQLDIVKNIYASLVNLDKNTLKSVGSDKISELDNHINACTLLGGYGVKVTPDYIREVETDRIKVEKLLIRFSRTVGAREPSLNRNEWNSFLKTMLKLRDKMFSKTCGLEASICISVFVESLLTSGNVKNFQIAGEHMMRTSEEEHEATRRKLYSSSQQKLSYESSVALVVKSSQEYFDASTPTSNDNMLSLARECLLLITDRPESVREKLDLIEGVVLLQKFGVDKLPLQVRLMEDRLSLVQMALEADVEAYRKTEALLRLAMLLHVSGSNKDDRKGKVLVMVVEKALSVGDFNSAFCLCQELIFMPFTSAWEVCLKLAEKTEFDDVTGKRDMLSFVACHCDSLKLPDVMELLSSLNCVILKKFIDGCQATQVEKDSESAIEETETKSSGEVISGKKALDKLVNSSAEFLSPVNMLKNTAKGTKAVLSATGNVLSATGTVLSVTSSTTKTVLSNVKNVEWWRSTIDKTLSSIPLADDTNVASEDDVVINPDLSMHGCPEFYSDIIDNSVSKYSLMITEEKYNVPKSIVYNHALLRERHLNRDDMTSEIMLSESELLQTLVHETMPYDFALALSYALAIQDIDSAYQCLEKLPVSALTMQLSLYYFALRLTEGLHIENDDLLSSIYHIPPLDLIRQALEYISTADLVEGSQQDSIAKYMKLIHEKMFQFAQSEKLQQLDKGIDVGRFTTDAEYREETILGLAMTTDDEQYKIAVSSAHRSGTDLWLVLMTHLEFLFTECQDQLSSGALQQRIDNLNVMPELSKKPAEFFRKMDTSVFPFIDGKDHDRLLLFFSLLSQCENTENCKLQNELCAISPSLHLKMLRKIKATSPNLDYKELVYDNTSDDGQIRILNVLRPVLDGSNVQMFAKMLPQIPYSNFAIESSSVYLELSKKIVMKDANIGGLDDIDWISRYESCGAHLRMCFPEHLLAFFEYLLFDSSSKNIPLGMRQDLMKRGVKLCKIQATKERKNQLDESIANCGQSFNTVLPSFLRMLKHLDSFSTMFLSTMIKNSENDTNMMKYLHLYDESQSKPELVLDIACLMLQDGASPSFVQSFLTVVPGNKWTCKDALKKCINKIVCNGNSSVIAKLSIIVKSVSDHEKEGGNFVNSKEVIDLLRPFCSDTNVASQLRVDVLKLLGDQFELEDYEARLLILHRTEAVIKESWDEEAWGRVSDVIQDRGIEKEEARYQVFEMLLNFGQLSTKRCKSLVSLLDIWPEFETDSYIDKSWRTILMALADNDTLGQKELVEVVRNRFDIFQKSLITDVFHKLVEVNAPFFAIKFGLLAATPELQSEIIAAMRSVKTMGPSQCDEEILLLMLQNSVAVHTVGTLYYAKITEYLISGECCDAEQYVHQLARQLQDQDHLPEAGTLLLNYRGTHPAFRTFNNALSSLKRWLNS